MTFTASESSLEGGAPIELYELRVGNDAFFLTTSEDEIVVGATTYTPTEVRRSSILVGPEDREDVLEVSLPSDHPFVQQYVSIVPGQEGTLTIRRFHRFDGDEEVLVWFKGIVRSVGFSRDGFQASMAVVPLTASLARIVPRFLYSGVCNHILYDPRCKVVRNDFRLQSTIQSVNGAEITVPGADGFVDGFFDAGFVELNGSDFRLVLEHTGTTLRLLLPFPGSPAGSNINVFAGCDHSLETCKSKFDNVINFGGFRFVPTKNPFETGLT